MCIWDFWQGLKTSEKQLGFTNQMSLKATALIHITRTEHKSRSKIQIKKLSSGK